MIKQAAYGDTALYDAIGAGAMLIDQTTSPETTNALVVLTDGQDTYSYRILADSISETPLYLPQILIPVGLLLLELQLIAHFLRRLLSLPTL